MLTCVYCASSERAEVCSFFVAIAVVSCVLIIWGPKTLKRKKKAPDSAADGKGN
jgi:hypothetical protein